MLLGFDISTSITGYTILDENNTIIISEALDLRNKNKYPDFWTKCKAAEKLIDELCDQYLIDDIWIEQSLQTFKSGFSSAQTLSTLSKFNGIFSWLLYKKLGLIPNYIMATKARKMNNIIVPKGSKAKEIVIQSLLQNESSFKAEYTKQGNIQPQYYDIADSIIIARAGFFSKNS